MRNNGYAQKGGRGLEKSKSYLEKSKQTRKMIYSVVGQTKKQSKANVIYNSFLIIVVIISALPLCFKEEYNIFRIIDMIAGVLFTIDYILRFITADFNINKTYMLPSYISIFFSKHICPSRTCLEMAMKNKGLERSFKQAIPKEVYENLEKEMDSLETK